jgi:hypothetical protein
MSVKNSINTVSGELSLLMCGASLFSKPFAGPTNGWIFMFLPWGGPQVGDPPPLVAAWGSSSCAKASSSSSDSENSSSKSLASAPDSESVQQPEFHLQLAHPTLFSFPPLQNVLQSDSLRLFCTTAAIAGQTECLKHSVSLQDESKTGLKLRFECWVKFR